MSIVLTADDRAVVARSARGLEVVLGAEATGVCSPCSTAGFLRVRQDRRCIGIRVLMRRS
jgi:hypothetical protein